MKRPKGPKFRNLYAARGTIWYARVVKGRRYRVDTHYPPADRRAWEDAAEYRDRYELEHAVESSTGQPPTFGELTVRYFESRKFSTLQATTQTDRRSHLAAEGPLLPTFGRLRADDVTADRLVEWWERESQARGWSLETGFRYLASVAEVLKQGRAHLRGRALPTAEARERMAEERRTAAGRARRGDKRPIRDPKALERLLGAAAAEGAEPGALALCLLDTGMRKGEVLALRWESVAWGVADDDPRRHVLVKRSRSRGSEDDALTKSGRERRVALSRRLRAVLGELYLDRRPGRDDRVFLLADGDVDALWARIVAKADLPGVRVKDLRDTYGSWLLTLGIPIQYVSRQLGHSSISVTETHYAEYLGDGGAEHVYVEPPRLASGEVPADLLARIPDCSQSAHTGDPYALPESLKSAELQ